MIEPALHNLSIQFADTKRLREGNGTTAWGVDNYLWLYENVYTYINGQITPYSLESIPSPDDWFSEGILLRWLDHDKEVSLMIDLNSRQWDLLIKRDHQIIVDHEGIQLNNFPAWDGSDEYIDNRPCDPFFSLMKEIADA